MTSKEALDNLVHCKSETKCKECKHKYRCTMERDYNIIKQALERLEVLEEIHRDDTKLIKELQRQLNMYKVNYYRLDGAVIELIDKFKIIKGSNKDE